MLETDQNVENSSSETEIEKSDTNIVEKPRKKVKFDDDDFQPKSSKSTSSSDEENPVAVKRRGRPKGSKNKQKLPNPPVSKFSDSSSDEEQPGPIKKRGRPKGSKNKPKELNNTSKSSKRKKPEKTSNQTQIEKNFHPMSEYMESYRKDKSDKKSRNQSITTKSSHFFHVNMILISAAEDIEKILRNGEFDLTTNLVPQIRDVVNVKTTEIEEKVNQTVYDFYESRSSPEDSNYVASVFKKLVEEFVCKMEDDEKIGVFNETSIGSYWNKKGNDLRLVLTLLEKTSIENAYVELFINRSRSNFIVIKYQHGGIAVQQITQDMIVFEHRDFYLFKKSIMQKSERKSRSRDKSDVQDLNFNRTEAKHRRRIKTQKESVKRKMKNDKRFSQLEITVNTESTNVIKKLRRLLFNSGDIEILRKHDLLTHTALAACPKEAFKDLVADGLSWGKVGILGEFQKNCQQDAITSTDESISEFSTDSEVPAATDFEEDNRPLSPSLQNLEPETFRTDLEISNHSNQSLDHPDNLPTETTESVEVAIDLENRDLLEADTNNVEFDSSIDETDNKTRAEKLV